MARTTLFKQKMLSLARPGPEGDAPRKMSVITVNITAEFDDLLARISRATNVTKTKVLCDFLKEQVASLSVVADAVEEIAPKSRVERPLRQKTGGPRRKVPSLKSIEAFAKSKKKARGK